MSESTDQTQRVAIACGGTGGHVFPGLAIADELLRHGCRLTLLVSSKEVDQQALAGATGLDVIALPAVGLVPGGTFDFWRGFRNSYRLARAEFQQRPPQAAIAMGGFTSAAPILAARRLGARTFLHESNTIPGRANRWLSWIVDGACVGFPSAAARLHTRRVKVTGTPVRRQLKTQEAAVCRAALGLDPARPTVLVMGGSQGAAAINEVVAQTLRFAAPTAPQWQWLHLAGNADVQKMKQAYATAQIDAVVHAFCTRMDLALGAATAAISRAGASSLAELAAVQIPAILIPYPAATDNHQYHNARAFAEAGAALLLSQTSATPENLWPALQRLVEDQNQRETMRQALGRAHKPQAAREIAEEVLAAVGARRRAAGPHPLPLGAPSTNHNPKPDDKTKCSEELLLTKPARAASSA